MWNLKIFLEKTYDSAMNNVPSFDLRNHQIPPVGHPEPQGVLRHKTTLVGEIYNRNYINYLRQDYIKKLEVDQNLKQKGPSGPRPRAK